ncbi:MAG: hypothetical protein GQE15_39210, partial [Archangiaceae bacterium]|nr:hypothetical protein [Archangiaceae bacterium]
MSKLFRIAALFALLGFSACGPVANDCGPATCSGCCAGAECIQATNDRACGRGGLSCNACVLGDVCQNGVCLNPGFTGTGGGSSGVGGGFAMAGGASSTGGGSTCLPRTCVGEQKNCGQISDGCGGMLDCGRCEISGETCGGSGIANRCGVGACTPTTCTAQGKNCGQIPDGCSNVLECGTCQGTQTCGGGGMANVCGNGCTPTTCAAQGKNCGQIPDGCGRMIPCGNCMGTQTCGGGGTQNVCGSTCTPTTCAAQGKNCGQIPDGCGLMLNCGSCQAPQTCGGAGAANVCGAACAGGCPSGFTCDATGACSGGALTNVVLDVPVPPRHTVTGVVRRNGATPTLTGSCGSQTYYSRATIAFTHTTDSRFNATVSVGNCTATTDAFDFTASLYPGVYKVTISKPSSYLVDSNLPNWSTEVTTMFNVTGPASNVIFDVPVPPRHTVTGVVTRNGAIPTLTGSCGSQTYYSRATIAFTHTTDSRFNATVSVGNCAATTDAFDFSASLYPGTYRVTVTKPSSYLVDSNLPNWSTVVNAMFTVSAPASNVVFDVPVPPRHTVTGVVTRNGMLPTLTGSCGSQTYYSRATITFTHTTDSRFNAAVSVGNCAATTDAFDFTASLYPGMYRVTVTKPTSYLVDSNLPNWSTEVTATFNVTGPASNVIFDVPVPPRHTVTGAVARNGMIPTLTGSCGSQTYYSRATIAFTHTTDTRFNTTVSVGNCTSPTEPFNFTASLYPGVYKVTISKPSSYLVDSNLPNWSTE